MSNADKGSAKSVSQIMCTVLPVPVAALASFCRASSAFDHSARREWGVQIRHVRSIPLTSDSRQTHIALKVFCLVHRIVRDLSVIAWSRLTFLVLCSNKIGCADLSRAKNGSHFSLETYTLRSSILRCASDRSRVCRPLAQSEISRNLL